jgi:glycosyltransferase involved in cell wall biosynthesis
MAARILYVVTEDWYFLSHRLPMARAAKNAGYEIHVATRLNSAKSAIEAEGFTPHGLSWQRGSLSPTHSLAGVAELRKLLRELKPDILHNISLKPVLLGSIASLGLSPITAVNSLTGLGTLFVGNHRKSEFTRPLVIAALKALLKCPNTRTIVQNPDDRRFVLGLGVPESSVDVIPGSGVDTAHFTPLPEPAPPITVAFVGRMLADKGVMTLIQAYSLATSRGLKLQLLLAGDTDRENPGSLAPEQLREFASAFGINWLGHVADIREVWARAHIAVLASRREGLPKSLLEAASCGRPMIATDTPGCREIAIRNQTALTFPVDDAPALAEALTQMAGDANMRARFGRRARELVEEKFSADVIGKQVVALYQSLKPA